MLARLRIELDTKEINYRQSSIMQGILFDKIDKDYAQTLHSQSMHPYSQYVLAGETRTTWIIHTLNKQAYQEIILPLMEPGFDRIHLNKKDKEVQIVSKNVETKEKRSLLTRFYEEEESGLFIVKFIAATAFKTRGMYYILPDVRLIFQNLMQKYTASSEQVDMMDEDTLEDIADHTIISRHNIRSVLFPIEGVKIPGFIGEVGIKVNAGETLRRYIRLLLEFGEYSGIGIKTAMGMGAFALKTEENHRG